MNKMNNYFEQLATAFAVEYFKRTHIYKIHQHHNEIQLNLYFDAEAPGKSNCINTKTLTISKSERKPHHLIVDEVWFGFDGDGSPWSDHMGGKDIDCTGFTFQSSIDHVIKEIVTHFNHLMK